MPMYDYRCAKCGEDQTAFNHISERHSGPNCCGEPMALQISAPAVRADLPGYQSPIDGRWIEGRVARNEDLRRNGCRPWEGMEAERQHAASVKASDEAKFDKAIEKATWDTFNNLSTEKQKVLKTAM